MLDLLTKSFIGVEWVVNNDSDTFYASKITLSNGEVELKWTKNFDSLGDLKQECGQITPILLCVSSDLIVHKRLGKDDEAFVRSDDILNQKYETAEFTFSSLVRFEQFNALIQKLEEAKLYPSQIRLGGLHLELFDEFLQKQSNLSSHELTFSDNHLDGYSYNANSDNKPIRIAGEHLDSDFLGSYATAVAYASGFKSEAVIDVQESRQLAENFKFQRLTNIVGISGLSVLLLIVIGNLIYFQNVNNEVNRLQAEVQVGESTLSQIDALDKSIATDEAVLKQLGSFAQTKYSKVVDEMMLTLPRQVNLVKLEINPILLENTSRGKTRKINTSLITISGDTPATEHLYQWVNELNGLGWIEECKLDGYSINPKTGLNTFNLLIKSDFDVE